MKRDRMIDMVLECTVQVMGEKTCLNCRYMLWGVALGVGVLCFNLANSQGDKYMSIPSRNYVCVNFEPHPGGR